MERLIALAEDARMPARGQLLAGITDLLIAAGSVTPASSALYADIVLRLIDRVDHDDRVVLARRLAPLAVTPRAVALDLARRPIGIAAPVLRRSPVLTEADLAALVAVSSRDHLLAIAARKPLPAIVADGLAGRGIPRVLRAVAGSPGPACARIAATLDAGRVDLSTVIAELAARDALDDLTGLLALLSGRQERTVRHLMFRRGEAGLRDLCRRMDLGPAAIAAAMKARARHLRRQAAGLPPSAFPVLRAGKDYPAFGRLAVRPRPAGNDNPPSPLG